jgi:hypothetical protein
MIFCVNMGLVWFSVWTASISLYTINKMIFVMVKYSAVFEVRTEFLTSVSNG